MKLRILLLIAVGAAGVGASFALAASGHDRHGATTTGTTTGTTGTTTTPSCQRAHVLGTASAPQTFTVTVTKSGDHGGFAPGQVVTVTVGTSGQTVMVAAAGCANGSTLSARGVGILAARPMMPGHTTSTHTTTTGTTSTQTTTTGGHWDGGRHHHGRR